MSDINFNNLRLVTQAQERLSDQRTSGCQRSSTDFLFAVEVNFFTVEEKNNRSDKKIKC